MVSLKNFLRHSIGSTASAISAPIAIPVKSNPVIQASRSFVDADFPVSIHTAFFKQSIMRKSTRSTASTDESPISSPVAANQTSGTSRAVTSAESLDLVQSHLFLQPDQFRISLGCSTDHSTAASMVIAHKVGCYTGKASLYAWNSFIPEDFSSVLVHLMADLVMNSYLSFPGLVELIVPPEVVLAYGSLPRPPENYFFPCSWCIYSDLVCKFLLTLLTINGNDIAAFWPSLARRYAHREGELMLSNLNQNHDCGDADVMFLDILPAVCSISETDSSLDMASVDLFRESYVTQEQQLPPEDFISHTILQLFSAHVLPGVFSSPRILLQYSAVLQQPDIQVLFGSVGCKLACSVKELYLKCLQISGVSQLKHSELASHISHLLTASHILSFLKPDSRFVSDYWLSKQHEVLYRSSEDEAEVLVHHELLLQQNLPQIIPQRQSSMVLVGSGWFMSILDFLYGSLPRPPDILVDISFSALYFILYSSCPRFNGLHLEGEY